MNTGLLFLGPKQNVLDPSIESGMINKSGHKKKETNCMFTAQQAKMFTKTNLRFKAVWAKLESAIWDSIAQGKYSVMFSHEGLHSDDIKHEITNTLTSDKLGYKVYASSSNTITIYWDEQE